MYADTTTSHEIGKLSGRLLDLLTELSARRSKDTEFAYVRPADYAQYAALRNFLDQYIWP